MKKSLVKVVTGSAVMFLLAGCTPTKANENTEATADSQSEVIATIGDETISLDDFYAELKAKAGTATLRSMIIQKVLTQNVDDAEALKKSADEEVNAQIESAGGEQVFQQLLAYQNLGSIDDFRESVYIRNLFQEVIGKNVDTSEEAIKAYYESDYAPKMEAQHILVETEEEANAVIERLNNGEKFEDLAKELSTDSSSADGGNLGEFSAGQMIPEFEEAVKSVASGELVPEPVKSQYGYHVINVINNGEKKPYDEVKDEVKQQYLDSKYNDSNLAYNIVGKFIKEKGVEIKDEDLKPALDELMAAIEAAEESAKAAEEAAEETTAEGESEETTAEGESEETEAEGAAAEDEAAEETTVAE